MIILIDNYDSFTWNLVHFMGELGAKTNVIRNDKTTPEHVLHCAPEAIILSPGPCTPNEAGICLSLVREAAGKIPIFGVCLGLQVMAQAFGGRIMRANRVMHGKLSPVYHNGEGVFAGIPDGFTATRYHSLIAARDSLPDNMTVTATSKNETVMAIADTDKKLYGVQFHPESIATQYGHQILANFLHIAGIETRERSEK